MHPGGTAQSFPANLGSFLLFLELPCRSSSPHILLLTFCSHWLVIFISFWKPHNLPVKSYVHSIAPGQLPHLPSLLCRPPLKRNETLQPMSAGLPSQSIPSRKTATDTFLKVPSIAYWTHCYLLSPFFSYFCIQHFSSFLSSYTTERP